MIPMIVSSDTVELIILNLVYVYSLMVSDLKIRI